jgi:MHS family shikimate/dehydroshikimate transporter-like MFS transporter
MGVGTMLIGLLPTYKTIGVAAPIVLVACRLAQGIAVGGEWGGAVLMVIEHSPPNRRGFYGSIVQIGFPLGMAIGTASFFALARLVKLQEVCLAPQDACSNCLSLQPVSKWYKAATV